MLFFSEEKNLFPFEQIFPFSFLIVAFFFSIQFFMREFCVENVKKNNIIRPTRSCIFAKESSRKNRSGQKVLRSVKSALNHANLSLASRLRYYKRIIRNCNWCAVGEKSLHVLCLSECVFHVRWSKISFDYLILSYSHVVPTQNRK